MSWEKVSLDSVTNNLDGKRIPLNNVQRSEKESDKKYPYFGANNIMGYINEYIFDEKILCIAEDGGSWGKNQKCCFIVNEKCWVNNHAHVITAKNGLSLEYLMYYLNHSDLNKHINGSTRGKLTKSSLNSIQIPLPSLSIQKKIAVILDQAQELRKKDQQLLAQYDALLQSIFYDMFGDPVTNERDWETYKFSEVGKLDRGVSKSRPRNSPELLGGIYPLIQTGDVANSDGYLRTYKSSYSELGLNQSKMWKIGTLCITIAANIAKTGILTFEACFPDSVVGFIPNEKTNVEFIQIWISHLQEMLEATAPESAQKNINLEILRNLTLPLPPITIQSTFALIAQNIQQQKQQIKLQLQQSEALFQTLLQKAFNGELIKE